MIDVSRVDMTEFAYDRNIGTGWYVASIADLDGVPDSVMRYSRSSLIDQPSDRLQSSLLETASEAPPWLRSQLGSTSVEAIAKLSDIALVNMLQLHNYRLVEKGQKMSDLLQPKVSSLKTRAFDLVSSGELPEVVGQAVDALDQMRIVADDGAIVDGIDTNAVYFDGNTSMTIPPTIAFYQVIDIESPDFEHMLGHESVHVMAGDSYQELSEVFDSFYPSSGQLDAALQAVDEALAEQVAQVLLGRRDIEDLTLSDDLSDRFYHDARGFVYDLVRGSGGTLTMRMLIEAQFGQTDAAKQAVARLADLGKIPELGEYVDLSEFTKSDEALAQDE